MSTRKSPLSPERKIQNAQRSVFANSLDGRIRSARPVRGGMDPSAPKQNKRLSPSSELQVVIPDERTYFAAAPTLASKQIQMSSMGYLTWYNEEGKLTRNFSNDEAEFYVPIDYREMAAFRFGNFLESIIEPSYIFELDMWSNALELGVHVHTTDSHTVSLGREIFSETYRALNVGTEIFTDGSQSVQLGHDIINVDSFAGVSVGVGLLNACNHASVVIGTTITAGYEEESPRGEYDWMLQNDDGRNTVIGHDIHYYGGFANAIMGTTISAKDVSDSVVLGRSMKLTETDLSIVMGFTSEAHTVRGTTVIGANTRVTDASYSTIMGPLYYGSDYNMSVVLNITGNNTGLTDTTLLGVGLSGDNISKGISVGSYNYIGDGTECAIAIGSQSNAVSNYSVVVGSMATSGGEYSMVFGNDVSLNSVKSIAVGGMLHGGATGSIAIGYGHVANAPLSIVLGGAPNVIANDDAGLPAQEQAMVVSRTLRVRRSRALTEGSHGFTDVVVEEPTNLSTSVILSDPTGVEWAIAVDASGVISATAV